MTKKSIFTFAIPFIVAILLLTFAIFIYYSNDHVECDTEVTYSVGPAGEKITTSHHVCKERFSF